MQATTYLKVFQLLFLSFLSDHVLENSAPRSPHGYFPEYYYPDQDKVRQDLCPLFPTSLRIKNHKFPINLTSKRNPKLDVHWMLSSRRMRKCTWEHAFYLWDRLVRLHTQAVAAGDNTFMSC